jgi:hypothetical protein
MRDTGNIRRVPVRRSARRTGPSRPIAGNEHLRPFGRLRRRMRGQSMLLIALCMMLLVALVALAIDGGSMLGQRREAQNSVDGAALAGTHHMMGPYVDMVRANDVDINGSQALEDDIRAEIEAYASQNGITVSTLKAYFVTDDKQLVTANIGEDRGQGHCGIGQSRGPCEVGENGFVPWALGAKGIQVRGTAKTDSFFMSIFGWDQVGAAASASAFMGVGALADNIGLVPMGLFTRTFPNFGDFQYGDFYPLIDGDTTYGSGNWGWVNYNGFNSGSRIDVEAWLVCGFNPSINYNQWTTWCPDVRYRNVAGYGPTQHYLNDQDNVWPGPQIFVPFIKYGPGLNGWWLQGSSGGVNANCQDFESRIQREDTGEGVVVLFPIFDQQVDLGGGGSGTRYHVRLVVAFRIYEGDVECRPSSPPTATPCPPSWTCATPTPNGPGGGTKNHWLVSGYVDHIYSTSSAGTHGDLRHTSVPDVFLDN